MTEAGRKSKWKERWCFFEMKRWVVVSSLAFREGFFKFSIFFAGGTPIKIWKTHIFQNCTGRDVLFFTRNWGRGSL